MQFYVMARAYNIYGGHSTLSLISEFLLGDSEDFGTAISELTVTFHFPSSGQARPTLESLFTKFHANRRSLPKVVFRRTAGKATIDIASELVDGQEWTRVRGLSLPLFTAAVPETIAALALLRKRLTTKDDFRLEAFLAHCNQTLSKLPSTLGELASFAEVCNRKEAARIAAMSPWDKVAVEWRDFHPDARKVLDDPFYWEVSNDFAPHGNDIGADLLADFRKWLRRNPAGNPIDFYRGLVRQWRYSEDSSRDQNHSVLDEAAVALAFAELKLRATCTPAVVALAQAAMRRQRQEAMDAVELKHKDDRLRSLEMLEAKVTNSSESTTEMGGADGE